MLSIFSHLLVIDTVIRKCQLNVAFSGAKLNIFIGGGGGDKYESTDILKF